MNRRDFIQTATASAFSFAATVGATELRAEEKKKTPVAAEAGLIVEWPSIADRIVEEMR